MNRTHPLSVLLGLALAGLCVLTMSQSSVTAAAVRVEYSPHPKDMVQIKEGMPYVVPSGKVLVVTGLGWVGTNNSFSYQEATLKVNGQSAATVSVIAPSANFASASVQSLATGCTAQVGSLVEPTGGAAGDPNDARAWGYLASL